MHMSLWTLVWAELWRRPERTTFTVISLAVGFLLFGLLQSVNAAFGAAGGHAHADRLMVSGRFGNSLPLADLPRIERISGVKQVTWLGLLPTQYRDPTQFVLVLATSPARFFSVLDEFKTSAAELSRLTNTRTGLIVLDTVAKRFGWKVGDQVSVSSPITAGDGNPNWTFNIVGIVTSSGNPSEQPIAVGNFAYFDANRARDVGTVAWFYVRVADPRRAATVGRAIDRLFANSPAPTMSQQESAFAAQGAAEIGDVKWLTSAVTIAVFFAMLFLTSNVMFESVRERTAEFAVLKTLGYSDGHVLLLVELEALALCLSGSIIGLGLAAVAFHFVGQTLGRMSEFLATANVLSPAIIVAGVGLAVALTLIAAAIPAWAAKRLVIVDALRLRV
jgi:putative ABC transport system permease protein